MIYPTKKLITLFFCIIIACLLDVSGLIGFNFFNLVCLVLFSCVLFIAFIDLVLLFFQRQIVLRLTSNSNVSYVFDNHLFSMFVSSKFNTNVKLLLTSNQNFLLTKDRLLELGLQKSQAIAFNFYGKSLNLGQYFPSCLVYVNSFCGFWEYYSDIPPKIEVSFVNKKLEQINSNSIKNLQRKTLGLIIAKTSKIVSSCERDCINTLISISNQLNTHRIGYFNLVNDGFLMPQKYVDQKAQVENFLFQDEHVNRKVHDFLSINEHFNIILLIQHMPEIKLLYFLKKKHNVICIITERSPIKQETIQRTLKSLQIENFIFTNTNVLVLNLQKYLK